MDHINTDLKKFHFIYRTTNLLNGRYYVGLHSTNNVDDKYIGSGTRLWHEVKKYGQGNFKREILEFLPSRQELKARERSVVNEEMLKDPLCMNLKLGGEGGWDHIGGANLTSPKFLEYKNSDRLLQNLRHATNCLTPESRSIGSKKTWTNNRDSMVRAAQVGLRVMNSIEANEKRKATYAERNHMHGEKNSQFGTCWVCNETGPIKIKKGELENYLTNGYHRGRKMNNAFVV